MRFKKFLYQILVKLIVLKLFIKNLCYTSSNDWTSIASENRMEQRNNHAYKHFKQNMEIPDLLDNVLHPEFNEEELAEEEINQCMPIHEPICRGLQYTHTWLPNSIGLSTQEEAAKRMNDYRSLINVGCSHYLKFFLCTIYFPMCTPVLKPPATLKPCQNLCLHVQSKCEPIMNSFRFLWPDDLICNRLPSDTSMCIQPQNYDLDHKKTDALLSSFTSHTKEVISEMLPNLSHLMFPNKHENDVMKYPNKVNKFEFDSIMQKMETCTLAELSIFSKQSQNYTCTKRCEANVFYKQAEKEFAEKWMLCWSLLCLSSCIITLFTFLIDQTRFTYPERSIVFISVCYMCLSITFLLRFWIGRNRIACRTFNYDFTEGFGTKSSDGSTNEANKLLLESQSNKIELSYLIVPGHESTWCTIVFVMLYFFGFAGHMWWIMFSLTWFLSASCKWGSEALDAFGNILHIFAWTIPALQTIIILIMHKIDADELTGLCFVGFTDSDNLLIFVILPQIIYLLVGIAFASIGFHSIVSVRSNLKSSAELVKKENSLTSKSLLLRNSLFIGNGNVKRLEKLMIKIVIFSTFYVIPAICVIMVNVYSYVNISKWSLSVKTLATKTNCLNEFGTNWANQDICLSRIDNVTFPSVEANMLRLFMSLVIGITSGMWVWCNGKTFRKWKICRTKSDQSKMQSCNLNEKIERNYFYNATEHPCNKLSGLNEILASQNASNTFSNNFPFLNAVGPCLTETCTDLHPSSCSGSNNIRHNTPISRCFSSSSMNSVIQDVPLSNDMHAMDPFNPNSRNRQMWNVL